MEKLPVDRHVTQRRRTHSVRCRTQQRAVRTRSFLRMAIVALLALLPIRGSGQSPVVATNMLRPDFWDTDGAVYAMEARGGVVYVGGAFSYIAPSGRKIAAVDAYTGEALREFPSIIGSAVYAMLSDQQGGWFIGGDFTRVGAVARTNLVHLLGDFSIDPRFAPNPNEAVRALALNGNILYLGGDFTSVEGQPRARLAALDLANRADATVTSWNPGANDSVHALLLSGDTAYVAGRFLQTGGAARERLAALSVNENAALPWQPRLDGEVLALGLLEDRIVAGGNFNVAGGLARNGLAAFQLATGSVDPNWDPNPRDGTGPGGKVTSLRVVCDTVYVGGHFTTIGLADRARVAAVDGSTGLATPWNPGLSLTRASARPSAVQTIEIVGDRVFIGGEFIRAQGVNRNDLLAVDADSGQLLAWNPGLRGGIGAVGVEGRTLLAAFITGPGAVERRNLAAFDEATGRPLDWHPDPNDTVFAVAVAGDTLYFGGSFTEVAGVARSRLAAVHATTGALLTDWVAQADTNILALAVGSGRLFAGGQFTSINGQSRLRMAALDLITGGPIAGWAPAVELGFPDVRALAVQSGIVYLGGRFGQVAGRTRNRLAAVDAVSGALLSWNPEADDSVQTLAAGDGVIYAGGAFIQVGGQNRAGLAAIQAANSGAGIGLVTPWNPGELTVPDLVPDVRGIALSGSLVYVGGSFLGLSGLPRFGLGVVQTNGSVLEWNPGASSANTVNALAVSSEGVYAGGGVRGNGRSARPLAVQGAAAPRFLVAFPRPGAPRLQIAPRDELALVGQAIKFSVLIESPSPATYQWWFNGVELPGQTNQILTLTNLQVSQSGVYEVRVANPLGHVTAAGSLLVLAPIQIVTAPVSVTAQTGDDIALSVVATGSPAPIYHWRLNGVLMPGAVYPTLLLPKALVQDGGTYDVLVANRSGTALVAPVSVIIQTNAAPFNDDFAARGTIAGAAGAVRGDNAGATREDAGGEPRHAGKRGGASVWLKWIAPADGRAVFSTRGSGVDTLLGIYTNNALATLGEVGADEDRGAFLTSRAAFNARAGREYQIAIDTVGGVTGNLVLRWEFLSGAPELPEILGHPVAQTVDVGSTARFVVDVDPTRGGPMRYQWFFGCQTIRAATNAVFTLTNVRARNAGFYHVVVVNAAGQSSASLPAALELGSFPNVRSFEKLEDLVDAMDGGGGGLRPASLGAPVFQLSLGIPIAQTFNTSTNGQGSLFPECGTLSGSSVLFSFTPRETSRVQIDTMGSSFDTVLAVFRGPYLFGLVEANRLECDNDSAPNHLSRVTLMVQSGSNYIVRVSGVGGIRGLARANWNLGASPLIVRSNEMLRVTEGLGVVLDSGVSVSNNMATLYQWLFNGTPLSAGTNAALSLSTLAPVQRGWYGVIVSNFAGVVTNTRAWLDIRPSLTLRDLHWTPAGAFGFSVHGSAGDAYAVQVSTNLLDATNWNTVRSGFIPGDGRTTPIVDPLSILAPRRFYRVKPAGDL